MDYRNKFLIALKWFIIIISYISLFFGASTIIIKIVGPNYFFYSLLFGLFIISFLIVESNEREKTYKNGVKEGLREALECYRNQGIERAEKLWDNGYYVGRKEGCREVTTPAIELFEERVRRIEEKRKRKK